MDELADMLRRSAGISASLRFVDTLQTVTLIRANANDTGNSGGWLNEIHLNNNGKDKIAKFWANFL